MLRTGLTTILAIAGALSLISGFALPSAIHALHASRPWLLTLGLLLLLGAITEGGYRHASITTVVEPEHEQSLRAAFDAALTQVTNQRRVTFFDPPLSEPRAEGHFSAHFPEIHQQLSAWDHHLKAVAEARVPYSQRVLRELDRLEIADPVYNREVIIKFLGQRTRPSLHLAVEEWPDEFEPAVAYANGSILIPGAVMITREETTPPTPEQTAELAAPVQELLMVIRNLQEVRRVAEKQDKLNGLQAKLRADMLEVRQAVIHITRRCAICARNMGVTAVGDQTPEA